ncbi:MAG: methylthioribulose 1-phosphate dehydratase [Acidobacteria bacterium]|nr:methylthioribulose 1-phosphate dehydratase [Acidobacteriota bacterium]
MSFENQNQIAGVAELLAECGRNFYQRGWVLGTSGNFSAVIERDPLRLLITASGNDKGRLTTDHFVEVDIAGKVVAGNGKPSDETKLHLTLVNQRGAASVLHTHSVWSTLLSNAHAREGGLNIAGWEMLKGLAGVKTHQHNEWLPILDNSQEMSELANQLSALLNEQPNIHGFLLRGHGLYTWGASIQEAKRHIEILEFLLEVTGRTRFGN